MESVKRRLLNGVCSLRRVMYPRVIMNVVYLDDLFGG